MLYHRQNQSCGYEKRKEKRLRAFTSAAPHQQNQNKRNAVLRGSSDTTTSTAKTITSPVTSAETCMEIESRAGRD